MAKRYPLPKFPDAIALTFKRLCSPLSDDAYRDFIDKVSPALSELRQRADFAKQTEGKFISGLSRAAERLIEAGTHLDSKGRSVAVGALSYLVIDDDPVPDRGFLTGLYDDAKVINHVLELLGIEDCFVEIPIK